MAGLFQGGALELPVRCSDNSALQLDLPLGASEALFVTSLRIQGTGDVCTQWVRTAGTGVTGALSVSTLEADRYGAVTVASGHNLSFDEGFLSYVFIRNGFEPLSNLTVCTLKLSRKLFPSLKSKSLGSVSEYLGIKNRDSHRALSDAKATAQILIKLIKKLSKENKIKTLQQLIEFQSSVVPSNQIIKLPKDIHDSLYSCLSLRVFTIF